MCVGNHEEPRVGIPHSNGSPFTGLYERGPMSLATTYAPTTRTTAVKITVIKKKKFIYYNFVSNSGAKVSIFFAISNEERHFF